MGSHGGIRTKIAILGNYGGTSRPIAGMRYISIYYASLRLNLKKKLYHATRNTLSFILLQGHKKRVRIAAVRWSLPKLHTAGGPTLYASIKSSHVLSGIKYY